jgi:hypothetical protein
MDEEMAVAVNRRQRMKFGSSEMPWFMTTSGNGSLPTGFSRQMRAAASILNSNADR